MKSLIEGIKSIQDITEEKRAELLAAFAVKKVSKGTMLQVKGSSVANSYYVRSGLLRSYTIDEKGKEHIYIFGPEGWLVSDGTHLNDNQEAIFYIDAIEDSEVEVLSAKIMDELEMLLSHGNLRTEVVRLMRRIAVLQKRVIMLMSATALERYQDFVVTYPSIVERVPQRMIASYLGITPEALSKVKANYLRKK